MLWRLGAYACKLDITEIFRKSDCSPGTLLGTRSAGFAFIGDNEIRFIGFHDGAHRADRLTHSTLFTIRSNSIAHISLSIHSQSLAESSRALLIIIVVGMYRVNRV